MTKKDLINRSDIESISLEHEKNPEFSNSGDSSNAFEVKGKGKVLRHKFKQKFNITDIEVTAGINGQLFRINSQNYQINDASVPLVISFDPPYVTTRVDIILLGTVTNSEENSINDVRYRGFINQKGKVTQDDDEEKESKGKGKDNKDKKEDKVKKE